MRAALRDAGLEPEQIGYINAHGTGTLTNDPTETCAIRMALGAHAGRVAISSTKSMHGHALGAAGAIEASPRYWRCASGILPPTANYHEPDPECDLDCIPNDARARRGGVCAVEFVRFRRIERGAGVPGLAIETPRRQSMSTTVNSLGLAPRLHPPLRQAGFLLLGLLVQKTRSDPARSWGVRFLGSGARHRFCRGDPSLTIISTVYSF